MNAPRPPQCQFVSAVCSENASSCSPSCRARPRWAVWTLGEPSVRVGWVCSAHAPEVVRLKIGRIEK